MYVFWVENGSSPMEAASCLQKSDAILGMLTATVDFMRLFWISMNIL